MDVDDLSRLVSQLERVRTLLGPSDHKAPIASEEPARLNARRSIVLARDVAQGSVVDQGALTCKRPGTGISPLHWDEVIGRRALRPLEADHVLRWDDLAGPPGSSAPVTAS